MPNEAGDVREQFEVQKNPVKVMRQKCRDCTNNQVYEIDNCAVRQCPLWLWRMGKNPYRTRKSLSPEKQAAQTERLLKARGLKKQK